MLYQEMKDDNRLRRILGPVQLTALGVGAVIGAGIFVATGAAAHNVAGPSLMLSYVVAGITCIFAALCYAEFAAMVPVPGSAFTYAYATLGRALRLDHRVGPGAGVRRGQRHRGHGLVRVLPERARQAGLHIPKMLSESPWKWDGATGHFVSTGSTINLPAIIIVGLVTAILVKGHPRKRQLQRHHGDHQAGCGTVRHRGGSLLHHEDQLASLRTLRLVRHLLFRAPCRRQVDAGGNPVGMLAGAAIIFFAYIGFDSVSTHTEEAKNPPAGRAHSASSPRWCSAPSSTSRSWPS